MHPIGWFAWLVVGGLAGWLVIIARGSNDSKSMALDVIIAMSGSLAGGVFFNLIFTPGQTDFNVWSLFTSFLGAMILHGVIRILDH